MATPPSLPVDAAADAIQLTAAEVQALALKAAHSRPMAPRFAVGRRGPRRPRAGRLSAAPAPPTRKSKRRSSLARTGAFFSNQGTPLSSRTVRSISRVNFPEGIPNQPAGALFGIENTNRGCDFNVSVSYPTNLYPRLMNVAGTGYSAGHRDRARRTSRSSATARP